ncbi:MAG TPA: YraN family protein [Tissierellaceae bacterium]|nr:YraN family protein [Tissierellaceae bacterium]
MNNILKGKKGELIAKEYLESMGYIILELNYRNKIGEIDLIVLDKSKDILAFIEVKTRTSLKYGYAYEAVNIKKQRKILNCSQVYIKQKRYINFQPRYDIIEIYLTSNTKINHIENAFC